MYYVYFFMSNQVIFKFDHKLVDSTISSYENPSQTFDTLIGIPSVAQWGQIH